MRHFDQLADDVRERLFLRQPEAFARDSDRSVLAHALGATLYVPATKDDLAGTVRRQAAGRRQVDGHRPGGRDLRRGRSMRR